MTFLTEGAILEWNALLITGRNLVEPDQGGIGYIVFAIAMTAGRLIGDRLTARIGDRSTLVGGGVLSVLGFVLLLTASTKILALVGVLLIGLGASNVAPVSFGLRACRP